MKNRYLIILLIVITSCQSNDKYKGSINDPEMILYAIMSLTGYYDPGEGILGNFSGLSTSYSNDITYIGSDYQDNLNLGSDRTQFTGNLNIFLGDGNDIIRNGNFNNKLNLEYKSNLKNLKKFDKKNNSSIFYKTLISINKILK